VNNKFKIVVGVSPQASSIELNGQPLPGVRRIAFDVDAKKQEGSFLTLEIFGEAEVEGEYVEQLIAGTSVAGEQP
jgi:hypothetical protein